MALVSTFDVKETLLWTPSHFHISNNSELFDLTILILGIKIILIDTIYKINHLIYFLINLKG